MARFITGDSRPSDRWNMAFEISGNVIQNSAEYGNRVASAGDPAKTMARRRELARTLEPSKTQKEQAENLLTIMQERQSSEKNRLKTAMAKWFLCSSSE